MSNIKKYFAYLSRALKRMRCFPWRIPILDIINKTLSIIGIMIPFLLDKMDDAILSFLDKEFGEVICAYADMPEPEADDENNGTIWTCWWQGVENAPLLVQKCIESIKRNAGNHPVVVITWENVSQYVSIPEHILGLARTNKVSLTHLSDVLRFHLLAKHGGLWLDATMYCIKPLDEKVWDEAFFSPPAIIEKQVINVDCRREVPWAICQILAKKEHPLCLCFCEFFSRYYTKYPIETHYFLTDYFGIAAMKRGIRENLSSAENEYTPCVIHIGDKQSMLSIDELPNSYFIKLTYKKKWLEYTPDKRLTIYGEVLRT